MLKDYIAERNMSIYGLAKECGVPYSTLNDFVNGKVKASECRAGLIRSVARTLGLTMDELYDMSESMDAEANDMCLVTLYGIPVTVSVRHKSYVEKFQYEGETVTTELCKVSGPARYYIREIAKWRAEEYIRGRRMAEWNTTL